MSTNILDIVPQLPSLDFERTKKFYTEKLGFQLMAEYHDLLILTIEGFELHMWKCDDKNICENSGCYIRVNDANLVYEQYKNLPSACGQPKDQPWNMREFFILDDNGNLLKFGQKLVLD